MAVQELGTLEHVADDARAVRNRDAVRLLGGDGRRMGVGYRADAADALVKYSGLNIPTRVGMSFSSVSTLFRSEVQSLA